MSSGSWVVNAGQLVADSGMTGQVPAAQLKVHHAPPGRFWTDPFPIVVEGKVWVFFADCFFASKKAAISCAPVSAAGDLGEVVIVLECPCHLFPVCL